ncbi:MAG: hypothetical protein ACQETE_07750 [Bacteroidota bacterium]
MTTFLHLYKGAAIYEVEEFEDTEGEAFSVKLIAKAKHPERENMKVNFTGEGATREQAAEHLQREIDNYLVEHQLEELAADYITE